MDEQPRADSSELSIQERLEAKFNDASESEEQPQEQPQEAEQSQEAEEPTEVPDDSEDVEYEGKTYRLPKELKDAVLRHADYTKKTQEVAEQRRLIEHEAHLSQMQRQFQESAQEDLRQLQIIEAQIQQYQKLDWESMSTDKFVRTKHDLDQLKEMLDQAKSTVGQKFQQFQEQSAQQRAQYLEQAAKVVASRIPNWGDQTKQAIMEYGMHEGFTESELKSVADPRYVSVLWKAMQYDKAASDAKRVATSGPVLKPNQPQRGGDRKHMEMMNFKKAMKSADPATKNKLILQRLEGKV